MISSGEAIKRACLARKLRLFDLNLAAKLIRQIAAEFRINSIHFSFSCALCKQWLLEELAKDFESVIEYFIFDIEVIVGVVLACRRVLAATVRLYKLRIMVLLGEFLRA